MKYDEAKEIALYRFEGERPVVIKCLAYVDFQEFSRKDSVEELLRKQEEWSQFRRTKAVQGIHPPWAGNGEFKEVCVKNANSISVIKVYDV
jgi:hypothetical protein